jgi:urease accessory protein
MICEKILGNISEEPKLNVDYVDMEWHELHKKLHRKTTRGGVEIGIRLEDAILTEGLKQGDILFREGNRVIAVNILPADAIVINVADGHDHMAVKTGYEIGNRHAPLFWGENHRQMITPYNAPMYEMLEKIHGIRIKKDQVVFNPNKQISSAAGNHSHDHGHEHDHTHE